MPRKARLCLPGYPMHVIQRGNDRKRCFFTDSDRLVYLSLLEERAAQFDCAIHAFVLMPNHAHILLTPARADGPSWLMKYLGQEYVQYVNRTHQRTGGLWEGRFRSSIVDTETYLMRCHRYIEMNPVRAGMVATPGAYAWSSFRSNAWGRASSLITPHERYLALEMTPGSRVRAYEALFAEPLTQQQLDEIRNAANGGFALGSEEFVDRIGGLVGREASRRRKPNTSYCGREAVRAE